MCSISRVYIRDMCLLKKIFYSKNIFMGFPRRGAEGYPRGYLGPSYRIFCTQKSLKIRIFDHFWSFSTFPASRNFGRNAPEVSWRREGQKTPKMVKNPNFKGFLSTKNPIWGSQVSPGIPLSPSSWKSHKNIFGVKNFLRRHMSNLKFDAASEKRIKKWIWTILGDDLSPFTKSQ